MYKRNFNLQKAPIVCYGKKFPHKRPPCYVLNTQKGPHDLAMRMISVKNIYLYIYNSQSIKCELYHIEKHLRKKKVQ